VDENNAFVLQQRAIFEMQHPNGSLTLAERAANNAAELYPSSFSIRHTQAEVSRRLAKISQDPLKRESLRRQAQAKLRSDSSTSPYDYQTKLRLLLDELQELTTTGSTNTQNTTTPTRILVVSQEIATTLAKANQSFPGVSHLAAAESDYHTLLQQSSPALEA